MEGEDNPLLAIGPVSKYPDEQEGGNNPVGSGLHPSGTPSRESPTHTPLAGLQATSRQLRYWQQTDPMLQKIRELASGNSVEERPSGATFFYYSGLIFRRWSPKGRDALSWDQLVQPQECWQLILRIADDLPTADHKQDTRENSQVLLPARCL